MGFFIHWHESTMDLRVFPIPIPPPTRVVFFKSVFQSFPLSDHSGSQVVYFFIVHVFFFLARLWLFLEPSRSRAGPRAEWWSWLMRLSNWIGPQTPPSERGIMPIVATQRASPHRVYCAIQALPSSQSFKEREHVRPHVKRPRGRSASLLRRGSFSLSWGADPHTKTHLSLFYT